MKARFLSLLSPLLLAVAASAQLPTGATVVAGSADITQAGNAMTITQASRNAVVNWQSFNLGAGASLRLQQADANAAMLARVVGHDASQLLGSLKADGKFFLINPKGVVIGKDAVIDTAAFMASTLDVSDDDFLRGGALTLKGDSAAGVVNYGHITAREGNVMLFAHTVKNAGEVTAAKGTVALGAGTEIYLSAPDAPMFIIKSNLPATTEKTGVENSGVIAAAQAQLEAAGGSIYELAVNQAGVIRATGVENRNGRVLLTASGGTVGVSGEVAARNADGSGGEILVGGDYRGGNVAVANAARTVVTATGKLDASATNDSAKAGRVIVWADNSTRFLGTLSASGQGGGFAEISGKHWLDFNPASTAQLGTGGTLLLDPDALIISTGANSGTSTSGTNPFTFGAATEPATLNVTTLQNQLAISNVILDTSTSTGDITFNNAVTWSTNNALTVKSGNNINLNADVTGGTGSTLALYAGRHADAPPETDLDGIQGETWLASNATISVGTLTLGANVDSAPGAGYTFESPARSRSAFLDGTLHVNTLEVDVGSGAGNVSAEGSGNAIGAFRTTGTGPLGGIYLVNATGNLDVTLNSTNADIWVQFITPGTLTLKSGSSLDFASPGTALFASTGGAFVNQAGASVFGANTRFLVYSNTTSGTTKGGLTGTEVFNHPFDENDDYWSDSISRFFFSAASGSPILTYTAGSFARTYGAANPALTFTTTGWQSGVTNDVTGAPTLSTSATQSSGVGNYTVNIAAGTLASSNYDFSFTPGTLEITRAPLTVTANSATRRTGLENPAFTASYDGFVLNQDASALGGTLVFSTPATAASTAGNYAVTPSGLTSSNYQISFLPGSLSIADTAVLLITANGFSRTYGAANPAFTASYDGLVGTDTAAVVTGLQFNTAATQSSGVGSYAITPFGATATGYDISYAPGTLSIQRAPLTISVPNQSRYYGDANSLSANYNGLVNNDTSAVVSGLNLATSATAASGAGNYAITGSGASAANYSITYAPGTLSVLAAPLTVTIADATRRYGDADPAFTFDVSGLKNNDTAANSVSVTNLASLASITSGIGSYGIIGFASPLTTNYTVSVQAGHLAITPRPLTITLDSFTREYGDANPAFTASYSGLVNGDTASNVVSHLSIAATSSDAGTRALTGTAATTANYTPVIVPGTLTITPAAATVVIADAIRTYGEQNPAFHADILGLKGSDTAVSLGLTLGTAATQFSDAGAYAITGTAGTPNYTLNFISGRLLIEKANASIFAGSGSRHFGDAALPLGAQYFGFYDVDAALAASTFKVSLQDEILKPAGTYEVGFTATDPAATARLMNNYDIAFHTGTLAVSRLPFVAIAEDFAGQSDSLPATYPVTAPTQVRTGPAFTVVGRSDAGRSAFAGTYTITPEIVPGPGVTREQLDQYYDFTLVSGRLVVSGIENRPIDPGLFNTLNKDNTINHDVQVTNEEIQVEQPERLTVAAPKDVALYTNPLTPAGFSSYFSTFTGDSMDGVRTAAKANYANLLGGKGVKGSAYESMDPAAITLLNDWLAGKVSDADFQARIAAGDAIAASAFTVVLPSLVEITRDKPVDQMTVVDREILGRLADLTEKRRADTVKIAEQKYAEMVANQQKKAEMNGLGTLFIGPGDFKAIVDGATQDAMGTYLAATLPTAAATGAVSAGVASMPAVLAAIFPTVKVTTALVANGLASAASAAGGTSGAGTSIVAPAVVVTAVIVIAVRAVQLGESAKNENAYNQLINSYKPGTEITSIATLKNPAMDQDMKLSTLMLAADLFSSKP